jgi:hypothetical protein
VAASQFKEITNLPSVKGYELFSLILSSSVHLFQRSLHTSSGTEWNHRKARVQPSALPPPAVDHSSIKSEIIAIMEEQRRGFDEMEALVLASLFWRRRRQTNSKMDMRQHLGLRKQVSVSCHRLPSPCADVVSRTVLVSVASPPSRNWNLTGGIPYSLARLTGLQNLMLSYNNLSGGGGQLRLMCSFGGRIVPRPTDKSLCYLGGETRIVAVDRHASLADVHVHLSRSLLGGRPFTLKYQLPNEDLDSLISVSTDEDLDNLIDEYDRVATTSSGGGSSRTSRIRLFLFPAKPESSSSLSSLLDDSSKSENWFVDALNSAILGSLDGIPRGISTDSASVNCLLGLEDDSSVHSRSGVTNSAPTEDQRASQPKLPAGAAAAAGGAGRHPHDVQSVPDSPMMDKNSSFGSTSSAPSLSNLPPIRVRPEDRPSDARIMQPTAVEDHFA